MVDVSSMGECMIAAALRTALSSCDVASTTDSKSARLAADAVLVRVRGDDKSEQTNGCDIVTREELRD